MPAAPSQPIRDDELNGLFAGLAASGAIALAVSGGADSLALLVLVDRWRRRRRAAPMVHVLTVDHRLRASSAAEARHVAAIAAARGLPHRTLVWDDAAPVTGIEAAAREARYRLLAKAAGEIGAAHLATAHHQGDQAETLLMRLGRGSGLAGLAGMRAERPLAPGLVLCRPLLDVARVRLAATVAAAGLTPAEDESNTDPRFARARLRALMPALAAEGIDAAGIARTAARLARASDALDHYATLLLEAAVTTDPLAVARVDREAFAAAPEEVRLRALGRLVQAIGGAEWPPRSERLESLDAALIGVGAFKRSLGGAILRADGGLAEIYRESGRAPLPELEVWPGFSGLWDHRFAVRIDRAPGGGLALGPLGEAGRRQLGEAGQGAAPAILAALPALRRQDRVLAVPALGFAAEGDMSPRATTRSVLRERLGLAAA